MNVEFITGNETLEELDDAVLVDESTEAEPVVDEVPEPKTEIDEASSEADTNAARQLRSRKNNLRNTLLPKTVSTVFRMRC